MEAEARTDPTTALSPIKFRSIANCSAFWSLSSQPPASEALQELSVTPNNLRISGSVGDSSLGTLKGSFDWPCATVAEVANRKMLRMLSQEFRWKRIMQGALRWVR